MSVCGARTSFTCSNDRLAICLGVTGTAEFSRGVSSLPVSAHLILVWLVITLSYL